MGKFRTFINDDIQELDVNIDNSISSQDKPYYAIVKKDKNMMSIAFDYLFNEESKTTKEYKGISVLYGDKSGKIYNCELNRVSDNKEIEECKKILLSKKSSDNRFMENIKTIFIIINFIRKSF